METHGTPRRSRLELLMLLTGLGVLGTLIAPLSEHLSRRARTAERLAALTTLEEGLQQALAKAGATGERLVAGEWNPANPGGADAFDPKLAGWMNVSSPRVPQGTSFRFSGLADPGAPRFLVTMREYEEGRLSYLSRQWQRCSGAWRLLRESRDGQPLRADEPGCTPATSK